MAKPTQEKKKPQQQDIEEDSDSDSSEDEDYVPDDKADNLSDGDDDMDNSDSDIDQNHDDNNDNYLSSSRSRKRRHPHSTLDTNGDRSIQDPVNHEEELKKKSRIDSLWSEFNAPVSKPSSNSLVLSAAAVAATDHSMSTSKPSSSTKTITITTSYDFAGETVTVTKDVPEDSKEARDYARKNKQGALTQLTLDHEDSIPVSKSPSLAPIATISTSGQESIPKTTTGSSIKKTGQDENADPSIKKPKQVRYVRRKSTLDELATTYGVKKPPKMNTLEKSKLDWNSFVGKEGIEDELKHHNKDGYMEKVAFLQRTDERRDKEYQMLKKRR